MATKKINRELNTFDKLCIESEDIAYCLSTCGETKASKAGFSFFMLNSPRVWTDGQFSFVYNGTPLALPICYKLLAPGVYRVWLKDFAGKTNAISVRVAREKAREKAREEQKKKDEAMSRAL